MNINWETVILNLRNKGWTHKRIGAEIGAGQTTVSQWARGFCGPSLEPAIRLLDLHYDECADRHHQGLMA